MLAGMLTEIGECLLIPPGCGCADGFLDGNINSAIGGAGLQLALVECGSEAAARLQPRPCASFACALHITESSGVNSGPRRCHDAQTAVAFTNDPPGFGFQASTLISYRESATVQVISYQLTCQHGPYYLLGALGVAPSPSIKQISPVVGTLDGGGISKIQSRIIQKMLHSP